MTEPAEHGDDGARRRDRAAVGWIWRALAALVVAARYVILLGWIAAAVAVTFHLPPLTPASGVGGLIPSGAPALVVLVGRVGSWPGRTVRPVRRPVGSPAAEELHGTLTQQD